MPSHEATVLIIDDDVTIRLLLAAGLGKQGFRVVEAEGGQEGVARFRSRRPDLVLIDVAMPDMDGFQVAQRVRDAARERGVPLVMLTGCDDPQTRDRALEAGAQAVLTKPVQLLPLVEHLRELLARAVLPDPGRIKGENHPGAGGSRGSAICRPSGGGPPVR